VWMCVCVHVNWSSRCAPGSIWGFAFGIVRCWYVVHVCVCVDVCLCVCACVCVCVCVCVCLCELQFVVRFVPIMKFVLGLFQMLVFCVCVSVCVGVCGGGVVCRSVCLSVCLSVCAHVCVSSFTRLWTHWVCWEQGGRWQCIHIFTSQICRELKYE